MADVTTQIVKHISPGDWLRSGLEGDSTAQVSSIDLALNCNHLVSRPLARN